MSFLTRNSETASLLPNRIKTMTPEQQKVIDALEERVRVLTMSNAMLKQIKLAQRPESNRVDAS